MSPHARREERDRRIIPLTIGGAAAEPTHRTHAFDARTTNGTIVWPIAAGAAGSAARAPVSPHKFEGKSVTQEDYPAYDLAPAPPPSRPSYTPNPHARHAWTTNATPIRWLIAAGAGLSRLEHQ